MSTRAHSRGFTLIELMLAMAFISFLLLFMVTAILQVTKLYVKGSSIRQINQTGRQLMDDIEGTLRVNANPVVAKDYNRLCVGNTSYVWNVSDNYDGKPLNTFSGSDSDTPLRFVSVQDPGGTLCGAPTTAISKANSLDLVGAEITPLKFSAEQYGKLWNINLILSTSGSNSATTDERSSIGYACEEKNQFCALGDFETSVYSRGGH